MRSTEFKCLTYHDQRTYGLKIVCVIALFFICSIQTTIAQTGTSGDKRMQWWREAKFGMFIHWGLYAIPAGVWKGKEIPNIGEHIMRNAKIPAAEYRKLAEQFNPQKFNAQDYVALAKSTGMKYIAITAKHHDGFAMFKSNASAYNVVDATPFKRDVVKELADECHEQGIKFCFYYSQSRDWNEPNGLHNDWDFKGERDLQKYLDEKVKPQLTELLTNYGTVGAIWFDTPETISRQQAEDIKALVRRLQPDCIISGRLGGGVETDYRSTDDNMIPSFGLSGDWETPATLNNTWGYKLNDHDWKSPSDLIRILFDICSKGGNYLLNIGPKADGEIPAESVTILHKIGDWMRVNSDAIYGTTRGPYPTEFDWGGITSKPGKLYLGISQWPSSTFILEGLKNKVKKIYLLADPAKHSIPFKEVYNKNTAHHQLFIDLPHTAPTEPVSIVVVEIQEATAIERNIVQQHDGVVTLPGILASARKGQEAVTLNYATTGGGAADYNDPQVTLNWNFVIEKPSKYQIDLITAEAGSHQKPVWFGGQTVAIACNGQRSVIKVTADRSAINPRTHYWKNIHTSAGTVEFKKAGTFNLSLIPTDLSAAKGPFTFKTVKLTPITK